MAVATMLHLLFILFLVYDPTANSKVNRVPSFRGWAGEGPYWPRVRQLMTSTRLFLLNHPGGR